MKVWLKRALVTLLCLFLSVSAFAITDKDGDGMDDAWEKKYNLDPENPMDADLDLDGDKVSNLDEFKKGTNPVDGKDRNGNGLPDDWEKFYFGKTTGIKADGDADKDGFTNKQEFDNGTNPMVKDKKKKAASNFKRPTPNMSGIRANGSMSHKHVVGKNRVVFKDPIGDDKGPGYYTYPTNPVYVKGGFDILKVEVDGTSKDRIVFKVTVNADLKQEWGMAADFDVQFVQIYIDTDGEPGSGNVRTLPGLNVFIHPNHAWDRVVLISPQPESRVAIEVEAKAKKFQNNVAIPKKIVGQGRTLFATVLKRDLGVDEDVDITKWKYQVFMQSNEGFPDKEDLLTRNVNEYNGLHRFGGGNDYWGDPEVMDMLAFPAKGLKIEAKRQFDILNVWESYPDPTKDIKAVVPMVWAGQQKQMDLKGVAADLATKMKPAPKADKYVSENFKLYGKIFTRWNWNTDPSKENFIKNSLELGIDGKIFTDKVDFYVRFEQSKWDNTIWHKWANDTPGQETLSLQAQKLILVKPLPTVDMVTIGNYEFNYSPWVAGAAWYPDRDKYKGLFVDGSIPEVGDYKVAIYYPLWWTMPNANQGRVMGTDFTYAAKFSSRKLIPGLTLNATGIWMTDFINHPLVSGKRLLYASSQGAEVNAEFKFSLGDLKFAVGGVFAWAKIALNDEFKTLEIESGIDYDGSGSLGDFGNDSSANNNHTEDTDDIAFVLNFKADLGGGFNLQAQYFNISDTYVAPGAARGDTAFGAGGFGASSTALTADVLAMIGNQSAHRAPQAVDFVGDVPLPALPADFLINDPFYGTSGVTWINDSWEGIASAGWKGLTVVAKKAASLWRAHAEVSRISFNEASLADYTMTRAYAAFDYSFLKIGRGLKVTASAMAQLIEKPSGADDAFYLSPKVNVDLQLSRNFNAAVGYRQERCWKPDVDDSTFKRHRISIDLNMLMPLGFIKLKGEIWTEDAGPYSRSNNKSGAFAITEWEYAF